MGTRALAQPMRRRRSPGMQHRAESPLASLQQFLSRNASPTFALPASSSTPPTITWAGPLAAGSVAATTLPNAQLIPVSSPLISGPLHARLTTLPVGAPLIDGYPPLGVVRTYTCKGQARNVGSPVILRFQTNAPVLELVGVVTDGNPLGATQSLIVDGELVPPTVLSTARGAGSGGWDAAAVRVDFGSSGMREIWFETEMFPAYLRVGQGDSVLALADAGEPQITLIGDSYLQHQSANFGTSALALELGARLGIRNIAVDSIGGTGYENSGGDLGNFNDRLAADATDESSIYLVMGGLNDYADITGSPPAVAWPASSTYQNAVIGYVSALRQACPEALIVVTAPFCPVPPMSDASYVANAATNASGMGDFLYKASLQKRALQSVSGPWIYIDVLMGTGWLNSSGASGDVTDLQWLTGGTPAPGTTATYKPGNTLGGGGGGFGGIASVPVLSGGQYSQAPEVRAVGGSGSGLLLSSSLDSATGAITSINIVSPGSGYAQALPSIEIDPTFELTPATLGSAVLTLGVNPDGEYPLPSFAPPGSAGELNRIYTFILDDLVHPSPPGVAYLSTRLAQNIYEAVMAL